MNRYIALKILASWTNKHHSESHIQAFANFINKIIMRTANNITLNVICLALYFVHKVSLKSTHIEKAPYSEYRVFLTSMIVADIALNDNAYLVKSWAQVSGIPAFEIIQMRHEFLEKLSYDINVPQIKFNAWIELLQSEIDSVQQSRFAFSHQRNRTFEFRMRNQEMIIGYL